VPIKIGAILPLTGSAAELAGQHKRGLELGVAEVNRLGGVEGRRMELAIEDDQNDPKTTVSAFRKLVTTDKIQAAVTVMSGPSMAVAPIADEEATVLFANCGHSEVTRLHKHVFRNFPSSNLEVRRMAKFAGQTLKLKSIWMLYIDDAYGQGARDLALKEFPRGNIQVLGTDAYGKAGTDIRPALVRVAAASPNAVYVYGYGQATADTVNQLREVGYKGLLLGSYNFSQPPLTTVSKDGIEGSYYTVPRFNYEDTDQGKQFLRLYQEKYNTDPLWNGIFREFSGWVCAKRERAFRVKTLGRA
jgi:branched-chain amino acid transport system substrate-binding protein